MASSSSSAFGARWSAVGEPGMTSPAGATMTSSAGATMTSPAPSAAERGSPKLRCDVIRATRWGQPLPPLSKTRELSAQQPMCTKVLLVILVAAAFVLAVVSGVWAVLYMTPSTGGTLESYPPTKEATWTKESVAISYAPSQDSVPGHGPDTHTPSTTTDAPATVVDVDVDVDVDVTVPPAQPDKVAMDEGGWVWVVVVTALTVFLSVLAVMAVLAVVLVVHRRFLKSKSVDKLFIRDVTQQHQGPTDLV